jgi:hypothetical protein
MKLIDFYNFWCLSATFSNISAISWQPVLVVEEAGVPEENHRPWASNWYTLSLVAASSQLRQVKSFPLVLLHRGNNSYRNCIKIFNFRIKSQQSLQLT